MPKTESSYIIPYEVATSGTVNEPISWMDYYPHSEFIRLLETALDILAGASYVSYGRGSILLSGYYGTGKTHAIDALQKLLCADQSTIDLFFAKSGAPANLKERFSTASIKYASSTLVVKRRGASHISNASDLAVSIQQSVLSSMKEKNLPIVGTGSIQETIIAMLSQKAIYSAFSTAAEETFCRYNTDIIVEKLSSLDPLAAEDYVCEAYRILSGMGLVLPTTEDLPSWFDSLMKKSNVKRVIFLWDDFTEAFINFSGNPNVIFKLVETSRDVSVHYVLVTHPIDKLNGFWGDRAVLMKFMNRVLPITFSADEVNPYIRRYVREIE